MCWKKRKCAEVEDKKHYAFSKCWQNRVLALYIYRYRAIYIYIFGWALCFDK